MSLTLTVDTDRWRQHQREVLRQFPGIIPVIKGNGYGFGNARLAAEADQLGVDMVAVGTYAELPEVRDAYSGDILVLTPWRPGVEATADSRVVHTVSRVSDLHDLLSADTSARVVVELATSMRRHGVAAPELASLAGERRVGDVVDALSKVRREGWALHLPLPVAGNHGSEVEAWISELRSSRLPADTLFVSHLSTDELTQVGAAHPDSTVRPRVGTKLWLGDRDTYRATATVLDVHPVHRGDHFGYRQRRVPGTGHLVIVAGGTAHGIALEAPSHVGSVRDRVKTLAQGGLEAAGRALSPFSIGGQRRWFAEPPHMQVSMVFLPAPAEPPAIGTELDVNVGMTLTNFDRRVFS